jgi:hypothetical protein
VSKKKKRRGIIGNGPFSLVSGNMIAGADGWDVCKLRFVDAEEQSDATDGQAIVDALNNVWTLTAALDLIAACGAHVRTPEDGKRIRDMAQEALRVTGYMNRVDHIH